MLFLAETSSMDLSALQLDYLDILIRLVCAMVVGTVIGMEREFTHRPAGLRTHILVALGACAVMITGQLVFVQYRPFGASSDPARLAAQVISGVGFLGAGTIMREGVNVKGLTTAASLWAVACLGVAAGGGYYEVALIGMVLMLITLTILEAAQNLMLKGSSRNNKDYVLVAANAVLGINAINRAADLTACHISCITLENIGEKVQISFHTEFGAGGRKRRQQKFLDELTCTEGVHSIKAAEEPVSAK